MTSPRPRRVLTALALVLALLGLGAWSVTAPATRASAGDSMSAPTSSRAPVDGVTPTASGRPADIAPSGRTRSRWIGDVLAVLALVAVWSASVRSWTTRRQVRPAVLSARRRPALGRAPPTFC